MRITGQTPTAPLDPSSASFSSQVSDKSSVSSSKQLTLANVQSKEGGVFLQALQHEGGQKTLEQRSAEMIPADSLEAILKQVRTQTNVESIYSHCEALAKDTTGLAQFCGFGQGENLQAHHVFLGLLASQ